MTSHKLVIKCGNFAVLVDFHVRRQGSSKDTLWFADHKREEVCMLLKDTVDSRVKQYLKGCKRHGQPKRMEHVEADLTSLTGDGFRVAAYFVKRWDRLRWLGDQQQHNKLRIFPDRLVICVMKLESIRPPWITEHVAARENSSAGLSEYFRDSAEVEQCKISLTQQKKRDNLRKIVKRMEAKKSNQSKPQLSKDPMEVYPGSMCSDRNNPSCTTSDAQSEAKCGRPEQPRDCINTAESSLELPVIEQASDANWTKPSKVRQQKLRSAEWLDMISKQEPPLEL